MHDYLFEHRRALADTTLRGYARPRGLDADRSERDMSEHQYAGRIEKDLHGGIGSGVQGTPTFFNNGVRYEGSYGKESLLSTLRDAEAPQR